MKHTNLTIREKNRAASLSLENHQKYHWHVVSDTSDPEWLVDDTILNSEILWWDVRRRLAVVDHIQNHCPTAWSEVYDLWYHIKFMSQEINNIEARKLGKLLANQGDELLKQAPASMIRIVSQPSDFPKICNSFAKSLAHLKKKTRVFDRVNHCFTTNTDEASVLQAIRQAYAIAQANDCFFPLAPRGW